MSDPDAAIPVPERDSLPAIASANSAAEVAVGSLTEALRQSREMYAILLDQLPVGVTVLDLTTGTFVAANRMAAEMTGLPAGFSLAGHRPPDFDAPQETEQVQDRIAAIRKSGRLDFGRWITLPSGEARWVRVSATMVLWEGHEAIQYVFVDATSDAPPKP